MIAKISLKVALKHKKNHLVVIGCKCFQYVSKISAFPYKRETSIIIKNAIILNIIHNMLNLCGTDFVI